MTEEFKQGIEMFGQYFGIGVTVGAIIATMSISFFAALYCNIKGLFAVKRESKSSCGGGDNQ